MDEDDGASASASAPTRRTYTIPKGIMEEVENAAPEQDVFADTRAARISDREDEYKARRRARIISPERVDPFADDGGQTPDVSGGSGFSNAMIDQRLEAQYVYLSDT